MSTLTDSPQSARHEAGRIVVVMQSGLELSFPVARNPRLAAGTDEQLSNISLSPYGLHWPDLDEDLSIRGIAAGDYGQRERNAA